MQESYSAKGGQVFTIKGGAWFFFLSSSPIVAHLYYLSSFLSFSFRDLLSTYTHSDLQRQYGDNSTRQCGSHGDRRYRC